MPTPVAILASVDYATNHRFFFPVGSTLTEIPASAPASPVSSQTQLPEKTGWPTTAGLVLEITPEPGAAHGYPGSNFIYPYLENLRQPGSDLLRQRTVAGDPTTGYALLRPITGYVNGVPSFGALIPCAVSYAPGYGPDDVVESAGSVMRLLLDPRPGGSSTASLPANAGFSLIFAQSLPSQVLAY